MHVLPIYSHCQSKNHTKLKAVGTSAEKIPTLPHPLVTIKGWAPAIVGAFVGADFGFFPDPGAFVAFAFGALVGLFELGSLVNVSVSAFGALVALGALVYGMYDALDDFEV